MVYVVHSSRVQYVMAGRSWLQEYEAPGHIVSTAGKQRWTLVLSCFCASRMPVDRVRQPTLKVDLSTEIYLIQKQLCPEARLHGDPRSLQVKNRD